MTLELYKQITLIRDIPDAGLDRGDVGTRVDFMDHTSGGQQGAILEVFNAVGESIDVVAVPVSAIATLSADHLPSVRPLEKTG